MLIHQVQNLIDHIEIKPMISYRLYKHKIRIKWLIQSKLNLEYLVAGSIVIWLNQLIEKRKDPVSYGLYFRDYLFYKIIFIAIKKL